MDASQIKEHMEVVGSDGGHVGTVDGVEGDRIKLTRTDPEASGKHHYLPLSSVSKVDSQVMLTETAEHAKGNWSAD